MVQFKQFRIGDLFEKININPLPNGVRQKLAVKRRDDTHTLPLIAAKMGDNGVMYWGSKADFKSEENCIAVVYDGAISAGSVYPHKEPVGIFSHSYLIKSKSVIPFEATVYAACAIRKVTYPKYSRDNPSRWDNKVEDDYICLPANINGEPDFEYMAERIKELEAYLQAAGLDDYELTDNERDVLSKNVDFKPFRIGNLFDKLDVPYYGKGKRNSDVVDRHSDEYCLPVTTAKRGNNGICRWTRKGNFKTYENVISVVSNGAIATGLVYYQPNEVSSLIDSYLLGLKTDDMNEQVGLYIACAMQKAIYPKYSRDNKAYWSCVQDDEIYLPVTQAGKPDYAYIATYIKAQEKLAIRDAIELKDLIIKETKKVVT